MSSSGLAYALALTWPVERCLMFAFQMIGVPLALHAYLRTHLGSRLVAPHSVCKYVSYFFICSESSSRPRCCYHLLFNMCWFLAIPIHSHPFPSVPIRSLDMWPVLSWIPSARSCWSLAAPGSEPHGARRRWSSWISWGPATPWREASSSSAPRHFPGSIAKGQCLQIWGTKWVWFDWLVLWDI